MVLEIEALDICFYWEGLITLLISPLVVLLFYIQVQ